MRKAAVRIIFIWLSTAIKNTIIWDEKFPCFEQFPSEMIFSKTTAGRKQHHGRDSQLPQGLQSPSGKAQVRKIRIALFRTIFRDTTVVVLEIVRNISCY